MSLKSAFRNLAPGRRRALVAGVLVLIGGGIAAGLAFRTTAPSVVCVAIAQQGQVIKQVAIAASTPAATGGSIKSGTYVLTAGNLYTGPGGKAGPTGVSQQITLVADVAGSHATVQITGVLGGRATSTTSTVSFDATAMSATQTCPSCTPSDRCGPHQIPYSVNGSSFTIYLAGGRNRHNDEHGEQDAPPGETGKPGQSEEGAHADRAEPTETQTFTLKQ